MTDAHHESDKARKGFAFAHFAFLVSCLAGLYLLAVMMLTHLGYIPFSLGFRTLTLNAGSKVAMAALAISGMSLLISLFMAPGRYGKWALAAVVVSGGLMGGFYAYQRALKTFPPIADVATDWDRPLSFSEKMIEDRGRDALVIEDLPRVPRNESMDWGGRTIADINQSNCPGAKTIRDKVVTDEQIAKLLTQEHYVVFGRAPWRVEATYQDSFYGFRSDVVIRIDPGRIDIRSTGREDIPDLGGNCRRVTSLVEKIRAL